MTVTGYAPDDLAPTRPDGNGTGIPARRTAFDDLADQAARLPWCWPALIALVFGFYQVGRPELWRDELASWSFASRPVPEMISAARHTGATQLAYYLLLHVWMAAFGDSADAMRAACLPVVLAGSAQAGRQVAWIPRPDLDLTDFAFFGRNLFYSTSAATALIILAVLAWAGRENQDSWLMVGYGLQYYLARDMPNGCRFRTSSSSRAPRPRPAPCTRSPASSRLPAWVPNAGSGSSASAARRAPTRP